MSGPWLRDGIIWSRVAKKGGLSGFSVLLAVGAIFMARRNGIEITEEVAAAIVAVVATIIPAVKNAWKHRRL